MFSSGTARRESWWGEGEGEGLCISSYISSLPEIERTQVDWGWDHFPRSPLFVALSYVIVDYSLYQRPTFSPLQEHLQFPLPQCSHTVKKRNINHIPSNTSDFILIAINTITWIKWIRFRFFKFYITTIAFLRQFPPRFQLALLAFYRRLVTSALN